MSRFGAARSCALVAFTAAFAGACGSDESASNSTTTTTAGVATIATPATTGGAGVTSTTPTSAPDATVIEVAYAGGEVAGGVRTETVPLGATVRLRVTSDVAEEVHVHTYDVAVDVAAGQTAELGLTATIPGRFEVELEKKGKQILVLEVR